MKGSAGQGALYCAQTEGQNAWLIIAVTITDQYSHRRGCHLLFVKLYYKCRFTYFLLVAMYCGFFVTYMRRFLPYTEWKKARDMTKKGNDALRDTWECGQVFVTSHEEISVPEIEIQRNRGGGGGGVDMTQTESDMLGDMDSHQSKSEVKHL